MDCAYSIGYATIQVKKVLVCFDRLVFWGVCNG